MRDAGKTMTDYTEAVVTYDNTRRSDDTIIELMARRGVFAHGARVLDFGCGTGNYLEKLSERYECELFGLEPSEGMRGKARAIANEKARYPDIDEIAQRASEAALSLELVEVKDKAGPHFVDGYFLRMAEEKNYSMFRMLAGDEYKAGLESMRTDKGRSFVSSGAGESLVWLMKGGQDGPRD